MTFGSLKEEGVILTVDNYLPLVEDTSSLAAPCGYHTSKELYLPFPLRSFFFGFNPMHCQS